MATKVLHQTPYGFPLDDHFYGQTFVITEHTKNSALKTAVTSSPRVQINSQPENLALQKSLASERFATTLICDPALNSWQDAYKPLLKEWLKDSPVTLALHLLRTGQSTVTELKKEFGSDLSVRVHLHCLADLFYGNLQRSKLSSRQTVNRSLLHKFIDDVNPGFVAVSDAVKHSFLQYGFIPDKEKIEVIRNGVSPDLYRSVSDAQKAQFRRDLGIQASKLVGYVGRLESVKGADNLMAILRDYNARDDDVGFVLATSQEGKDFDRFVSLAEKNLGRLINHHRLKFCVDISKLTGGFFSKDLLTGTHFYESAVSKGIKDKPYFADVVTEPVQPHLDVYLHPANSEALSLSALEASMSGVPVVASNVGGIPEFVNFNSGSLIDLGKDPRDSVQAFRKAVDYWLSYDGKREEIFNVNRANLLRSGFDSKSMANKLDEFYVKNN